MNRAKVSVLLWTAALASAASTAQADIDLVPYQIPVYAIDDRFSETFDAFYNSLNSEEETVTHGGSCLGMGGVIQRWGLDEKNLRDFRMSDAECRTMLTDGTLDSANTTMTHFRYYNVTPDGSSSVPEEQLPVGVRCNLSLPFMSWTFKVADVSMMYADAGDIVDGIGTPSVAPSALGHPLKTRYDELLCDPYEVLTGLWIQAKHGAGGDHQAEILGVTIECAVLDRTFITPHPELEPTLFPAE